jgi:hypothetical protein
MDINSYTNDNAVLAYIDLLGTKSLYASNTEPLEDQAKRLYSSLLLIFITDFKNHFEDEIHSGKCRINIYGDSIMMCFEEEQGANIDNIISFLLKYQRGLMFADDFDSPIASRAIIGRYPYFQVRVESPLEDSILNSKYTDWSLCGGKGMIELDHRLKGLPIGVYIDHTLYGDLKKYDDRLIKIENDNIYFMKQKEEDLSFYYLPAIQKGLATKLSGETLTKIIYNMLLDKMENDNIVQYWMPWLDIHEGRSITIRRVKQ